MDEEKEQEDTERAQNTESQMKTFFGTISSGTGLLIAVAGLLLLLFVSDIGVEAFIPLIFVGLVMGAVGYSLGPRRLGTAVLIITAAIMIFGLLTGGALYQTQG